MSKFAIEIKWAIRFTLFAMAWVMLEKAIGWHSLSYIEYLLTCFLFAVPGAILIYLTIKEKRDHYYKGEMTWMQGTLCGLFLTFICVLMVPISTWITINYISADFYPTMQANAIASGNMPQEEAELFFGMRGYILDRVQMGLSGGIVVSAIVSHFLKTKVQA